MRNWSIFSDNVRYIQHDQVTPQNLNVGTLDYRDHKELYLKLREKKGETLDVDFGLYPDILDQDIRCLQRCICRDGGCQQI